jgi:hypothetical protein
MGPSGIRTRNPSKQAAPNRCLNCATCLYMDINVDRLRQRSVMHEFAKCLDVIPLGSVDRASRYNQQEN